ncbi:hypothetical protein LTR37_014646 [Vermiconidia calcicola]|uniref:Uncharacterized protein n=1 Tax=Vermiconidia calcicola TaxID=1690605 RepID=A0ACC3MT43_9PEZI|nr:hypothetical protein LTR37_014646 [Vermiconidia calcicola]
MAQSEVSEIGQNVGWACREVFTITELAEMIFLHLPLEDLIHAKDLFPCLPEWSATWYGSANIQRVLYLRPFGIHTFRCWGYKQEDELSEGSRDDEDVHEDENDEGHEDEEDDGEVESDDEDEDSFPRCAAWETKDGVPLSAKPIINPFMNYSLQEHDEKSLSILADRFITGLEPRPVESDDTYDQYIRFQNIQDEGWWKDMLFTQPPTSRFRVWCPIEGHFSVEEEGGLTVGDVRECLRSHLSCCGSCDKQYLGEHRWHWDEDEEIDWVDEDITGYQMLDELKERKLVQSSAVVSSIDQDQGGYEDQYRCT